MLGLKMSLSCLLLALMSLNVVGCGKRDSASKTVQRTPRKSTPGASSQKQQQEQQQAQTQLDAQAAAERARAEERAKAERDAELARQEKEALDKQVAISGDPDELERSGSNSNPHDDDDNDDIKQEEHRRGTDTSRTDTRERQSSSSNASRNADEQRERSRPRNEDSSRVRLNDQSVADQAEESRPDNRRADPKGCDEISSQLSALGWEKFEIDVPEDHQDSKSKKIRVAYYKQKGSELKNPVFFISNYYFRVRKNRLESFNKIAQTYEVDPILMDVRGAGCSAPLPLRADLKTWQHYASRAYALDAEIIRKKELKDRKWKIWAHQLAGYMALRSVQLVPSGISSIHITDFTPMRDYSHLMLYRIEAQSKAWEDFIEFIANEKKFKIGTAEIDKAKKTLKEKWPCKTSKDKLCGEAIFDAFAHLIKSTFDWNSAFETLEALIKGEKDHKDIIKNTIANLERAKPYNDTFRLIDFDEDKTLTACQRAIEASKKHENLRNSPINSCRLETALSTQEQAQLLRSLQFDKYDYNKIKTNMKTHAIKYYWLVANNSLFFPVRATEEHFNEFKDFLFDNTFYHSSGELQVEEDPEFLNYLKPPQPEDSQDGRKTDGSGSGSTAIPDSDSRSSSGATSSDSGSGSGSDSNSTAKSDK